MSPNEELIIKDFAKEAENYCRLIENYKKYQRETFLCYAIQSILCLFALIMKFPPSFKTENTEKDTALPEIKNEYMKLLSEYLGDWNYYREVFDSIALVGDSQGDVVDMGLADDFADIYTDLKRGLFFYKQEQLDGINEAVFQWRFNFEFHWGRHATSALRAIYCRLKEIWLEPE